MRKTTLIKILCLAIVCAMVLPMVLACNETPAPVPSTTESSKEEKVEITFDPNGGVFDDEPDEEEIVVKITVNTKLSKSKLPSVSKDGCELVGWAYDRKGNNEWGSTDTFDANDTLYAIWSDNNSGNNGGNNGGNTGNEGGDNTPKEMITIEYDTGTGKFEDINAYEKEIEKSTRYDQHPTPIHNNPAMKFDGWFFDNTYNSPVSNSFKYEESVKLYAKWSEMTKCSDGSYNHQWGYWDVDTLPNCVKAGTQAQYCNICNAKSVTAGDPAKGHDWSSWQEAFMRKERSCERTGCDEVEKIAYENVTGALLGLDAIKQIKIEGTWQSTGTGDADLFDGNWKQPANTGFASNGQSDELSVTVTLLEPSVFDRVYLKGRGTGSVYIQILYQGDSDYTPAGTSAFVGGAEDQKPIEEMNIPYAEVDTSRAVVAVRFVQKNPPNGTSIWEEFAFVRVKAED